MSCNKQCMLQSNNNCFRFFSFTIIIMNNQTKSSPQHPGLFTSMGHFTSILCLLFILTLILFTLFLLFTKHKDNTIFNENESADDISTNTNERKSITSRQSRQYSSTINSQQYPSFNSFRMDIDEPNTRSSVNLLASK